MNNLIHTVCVKLSILYELDSEIEQGNHCLGWENSQCMANSTCIPKSMLLIVKFIRVSRLRFTEIGRVGIGPSFRCR